MQPDSNDVDVDVCLIQFVLVRRFSFFIAFGKDYLDHLLLSAESGMVKVSLDSDERLAGSDNRLALVEGRVDLVRRDLSRSEQRLDVVVARAAEDSCRI